MPKYMYLATPLKDFKIPIVSWRPNNAEFMDFRTSGRVNYNVPQKVKIKGSEWYRVAASDVNYEWMGGIFLPLKYYPLWRRLVYGALLQENMFHLWIGRTHRLKKKKLNRIEEEEIRLKNTAGVKLIQYLLYRRHVLEELKELQFEDPNPVVHSLIEFGIRESRDWMFETYKNAKKQGGKYLRLDPTSPKNKKVFEEGFHKGLDILFPPEDDNWWKGDFTYLDFKEVFNEIAKIAPITMADESFEENKWIIESSNQNKPVQWNESEFTFFSERFMEYLEKKGKDPRIVPSDYFIWYCSVMEGEDDSDIKEGVLDELEVVLGDNYDEKYLKGVKEKKWNVEFFIKLLTQKETSSHRNRTNALGNAHIQADNNSYTSLPEGVEQVLQNYRQPNSGLELPEALEQLIRILGPGSGEVSSKLLDDLAVDPYGVSRVSWDIALQEAIVGLNKLKRVKKGKEKETGEASSKFPPDIDGNWEEQQGTSTAVGNMGQMRDGQTMDLGKGEGTSKDVVEGGGQAMDDSSRMEAEGGRPMDLDRREAEGGGPMDLDRREENSTAEAMKAYSLHQFTLLS